jgi:hypothetical protein
MEASPDATTPDPNAVEVPVTPRPGPARLRLSDRAIVAPESCACCGAPALRRVAVADRGVRRLLVGYCEPCAAHVARETTRRLAAVLSSALLGAALAASLPIVAPHLSLFACVTLTLLGGLVPLTPLWLFRRAPAGHARRGAAVFFDSDSELVCFNPDFAEALAASSGAERAARRGRGQFPRTLLPALACAMGAAASYVHQHPPVRVINGNVEAIEVFVEGRSLGRVEPSGTESATAGLSTRIPAGSRVLRAVAASGARVAESRVDVLPGRNHLFAPGAPTTCFWLERAVFGRARGALSRVPLEGSARFWAIPEDVLGWFVPSPPSETGARTTGGSATVLRQGPCDEMPLER